LGAGKTAVDAILHLLSNGIDESRITWIISRDVWFFLRNHIFKSYFYKTSSIILKSVTEAKSIQDAFLTLEQKGIAGRLQPKCPSLPEVFKGALIYAEDLHLLRTITNTVRLGRACSNFQRKN